MPKLIGFLFLFASGITPQADARTIYFYVDCPNTALSPGHTFLQLIPMGNNPQVGNPNLVYGFYPAGWNIFGGPGVIKNDSIRPWDWRICYSNITRAQYNAAVAKIAADIAAPPNYHLLNFNCTNWITCVATAAGIALPAKVNAVGVADPFTLWGSLKNLGIGGMFGGGVANDNADGLAANGEAVSLNPPRDFSFGGIQAHGHADPSDLALVMQLAPANINDLGVIMVRTPESLQVDVVNAPPSEALISMDWGDATSFESQAPPFSHQYSVQGSFQASLLVVNEGAVHSYQMTVLVDDNATTGSVMINVPTSTPASGDNPGFEGPIPPVAEGAPPIPTVSTWGMAALVLFVLVTGTVVFRRKLAM